MSVRVTCINKSGGYHENPHEAISHFGWIEDGTNRSDKSSREQMWTFVNGGGVAYVKDMRGNIARLVAKTNTRGTKYVQTVADGKFTDNLLALPECG